MIYISGNNKKEASNILLYMVIFLLVSCKAATDAYLLFFRWSEGLMSLINNIITFGLVLALPVLFCKTYTVARLRRLLLPVYFLMLIIILKHVLLIAEYGGLGFLSPSFSLPYVNFTEGFYLINIFRWLSIGSLIMWIVYKVDSKKILNGCLKSAVIAFLIPVILMILFRPDMIGIRKVMIDDVSFGGGFWNIGVRAFLAFGWLWLSMYFDKSQKNRRLFLAGTVIIVMSGFFGISRALVTAVSIGVLFYILFNIKSTRPIKFLIIASICILITYSLFGNAIIDSFINRFSEMDEL